MGLLISFYSFLLETMLEWIYILYSDMCGILWDLLDFFFFFCGGIYLSILGSLEIILLSIVNSLDLTLTCFLFKIL